MVESIACVEWIQRNIFDVGRSNTGLEGSAHSHALSLINHGNASDGGDIRR